MELNAAGALRPDHRRFGRGLRGTAVDPDPERLLQNDVDDLVRARWKRPGKAGRTQKSAALTERADNTPKRGMWQDSLLNFHGGLQQESHKYRLPALVAGSASMHQ
ncbi:MAG TPA: hypothetical protein VFP38_11645 [Bradyrhizobium sp.]|nr:hypothetical protein [Bradyrhizobium sp.]